MEAELVTSIFIGLSLCLMVECTEPKCSKFDYEEKLLEKMIKMEFNVERILGEIKTTKADVNSELVTLRKERDELKQEIANSKEHREEMNEKNLASFEELKDQLSGPRVEFRARGIADTTPTDGQVMVFSKVDFNQGQGYDATTGYFTAPAAGTYLLMTQICLTASSYFYFDIVVDDVIQTAFQASAYQYNYCLSWLSISNMEVGTRAWLKSKRTMSSNVFRITDNHWNIFSGVLINKH